MKKIYLPLIGGLGNQLFIYAFGKYLIKKYKVEIIFDTSYYSYSKIKIKLNTLSLNEFNFINLFGKKFSLLKFLQILPNNFLHLFLKTIFSNKIRSINYEKGVDLFSFHRNLPDSNFIFKFNNLEINSIDYLYGYFQNKEYLHEISEELVREYVPNDSSSKKKVLNIFEKLKDKSCAIHIRSTHLNNHDLIDNVDGSYYQKTLNFFLALNIEKFIIFTDNIDYSKDIIKNIKNIKKFVFVDEYQLSTIEEFYLLSKFENVITSISTFSWWAAFLNFKKKNYIIQPNLWFKNTTLPKSLKIKNSIIL